MLLVRNEASTLSTRAAEGACRCRDHTSVRLVWQTVKLVQLLSRWSLGLAVRLRTQCRTFGFMVQGLDFGEACEIVTAMACVDAAL